MIKLQETFQSGAGGFSGPDVLTYTQIVRSDSAAVYQRSRDNKIKDYEVFKIKIIPKGNSIFNSAPTLDDEEHYPSNNDFGRIAHSFHGPGAKEAAVKKFIELNQEKEEEINPAPEKEMVIPDREFTVGELAELNGCNYITSSNFVKENLDKTIKYLRLERKNPKGKMSKIYQKL